MQNKFAVLFGTLFMAVLLVGAGCSSETTSTTNTDTETTETSLEVPAPGAEGVDEMQEADEAEVETSEESEEAVESTTEESAEAEESEDEEAAVETHTVSTVGNTFSPSTLTVSAGDMVQFELGATHNVVEVTEADWEAKSATQKAGGFSVDFGGTEVVTFDEPGTYYYVCAPHVAMGMRGMIVVE